MKTLLEAVNDVLLQVGERPTTNLQTVVGRKAVLAIEAALIDINVANDWSFKKLATPVTQQVQELFTIPGLERVDRVAYRDPQTNRERELPYMATENLRQMYRTESGRPRAWALADTDSITVLPYPTDGTVIVYGTKSIVAPKEPGENIPLPDRFYPLMLSRALYHMLITHLADSQAAASKNQEFLTLVSRFIQKESASGRQGKNMYRNRRWR